MPPLTELHSFGQSLWYDNISRDLLQNGAIKTLIAEGVSGMTSNPAIFKNAITGSAIYDEQIKRLAQQGQSAHEIYEAMAIDDIRAAADILKPVFERTGGVDGYVSLEVNPFLADDTQASITEARRLFEWVARSNVMIKIPATPAGLPAIEACLADGLNINITLIFSRTSYRQVMEAYLTALERRAQADDPISGIASVASFFVSRVDTLIDQLLADKGRSDLQGKAAIANARLAYQLFRETFESDRFAALQAKGAWKQRPLWASTSTKNPAYRDVMYVEELIGADTVNTAPPQTIDAFRDHGATAATLETRLEEAHQHEAALIAAGIDLNAVTDQLLDEAVRLFSEPFQQLVDAIEAKRAEFVETQIKA